MKKDIICIICLRGFTVTVEGTEDSVISVTGYGCNRGKDYATAEFTSPVRILTTTVKINGNDSDLIPVRSSAPLPKDKIMDCMEIIKKTAINLPVNQYDVVIKDICKTGIDIVATKAAN